MHEQFYKLFNLIFKMNTTHMVRPCQTGAGVMVGAPNYIAYQNARTACMTNHFPRWTAPR